MVMLPVFYFPPQDHRKTGASGGSGGFSSLKSHFRTGKESRLTVIWIYIYIFTPAWGKYTWIFMICS